MSQRCHTTVTIQNRLGLHARPAMAFVDVASTFKAAITVRKDAQAVDGKSIMQMMMLAASQGTQLELQAIGPDADAALAALTKLVDDKFGED
jgi:phosphocarrier protein HPr